MIAEREQGLRIESSLEVAFFGQTPPTTVVTPLLDTLNQHRLKMEQKKRVELAQKSSLETWEKVLRLQKRILNEFELRYENWELVDNGGAMLVDLAQDGDTLDLTGDERLCMSPSTGRNSVMIGYFEEIEGKRLKIGLARDADPNAAAKRGRITLDNSQLRSILARQEDAFRRLKFGESFNPALYHLLTNQPHSISIALVLHSFGIRALIFPSRTWFERPWPLETSSWCRVRRVPERQRPLSKSYVRYCTTTITSNGC